MTTRAPPPSVIHLANFIAPASTKTAASSRSNQEFDYQCTNCGQISRFKLTETVICKQFLIVDGKPSTERCYGAQMLKPRKEGWLYEVAR